MVPWVETTKKAQVSEPGEIHPDRMNWDFRAFRSASYIIPTGAVKVNELPALEGATKPLRDSSGLHAPCGCYGESASRLNRYPSEPTVIEKYSGHDDKVTLRQGVVLVLGDLRQINADAPESLRDVGAYPIRGQDHRLTGDPLHAPCKAQVSLLGIGRPDRAQHDHRREGAGHQTLPAHPLILRVRMVTFAGVTRPP